MKTRNQLTKLLNLAVLMSMLLVVLGAHAQPVQAVDQTDEKPSPMVGLARGQTARLNVVNIGDPNLEPCEVQMLFYDSQGKALARDVQKLDPGVATFLDLGYSDIGDPNSRVQIRAWIKVIGDPTLCLSSLEVFDDETGRTTIFVGDPNLK